MDLDGKTGIRSSDNDRVYAITGPERRGKSHLLLNMFDYWYISLLEIKDYGEEMIKHFAANKKEFVLSLSTAPKFYMAIHDEILKDLYARDSISTFNKDLNKAYFIIGGKNLWTGLACPSILDLDSNFRKRRTHGMFHVYQRGKVAFYNREKLDILLPALERMSKYNSRPDPKNARDEYGKKITPTYTDTFPRYEGPLLKVYLERKNKNMQGTVDDLMKKHGKEEDSHAKQGTGQIPFEPFKPELWHGFNNKQSVKQLQKETGLSYPMIHAARKEWILEKSTG